MKGQWPGSKALIELQKCEAFARAHEAEFGRFVLSRLHHTVLHAPEWLRCTHFEAMDENYITKLVQTHAAHLERSPLTFFDAYTSNRDLFERAVAATRIIDASLSTGYAPIAVDSELYRTSDRTFVLPVSRYRPDNEPSRRHSARRRLLLHHRIVPTEIDGNQVRIHICSAVARDAGASFGPRRVGCGVFPGTWLERRPEVEGFVAGTVRGTAVSTAALISQYDTARQEGCDSVLWPELLVPPTALDALANRMAEEPLDSVLPPVVVAGSWHVREGEGWCNRGTVLDGFGRVMLNFDKARPFTVEDPAQSEEIVPGSCIDLLLTQDELILFTICKDFCDAERENLLTACDATYVFVPSNGEASTCSASITTANRLQNRVGTLSIVAQQGFATCEQEAASAAHYVLRAPRSPQRLSAAECVVTEHFSIFLTGN